MHMILYPNGQSLEHCTSDAKKEKCIATRCLIFDDFLKLDCVYNSDLFFTDDRIFTSSIYLEPVPPGKLLFLIQFNSILY